VTLYEPILGAIRPGDYELTEAEFWAVYSWVDCYKDELGYQLKEGLIKLIYAEMRRRMGTNT
jgi:hypothetical protein